MRKYLHLALCFLFAFCLSVANAKEIGGIHYDDTIIYDGMSGIPFSASNPLPVAGSFSASLGGFTPSATGARMTPLSVATSDSSQTLPTGTVVVVSDVGSNPMYCNVNAVAATTGDQLIPPNSWFAFTVPSGVTVLHCIATGGSTTANGVGGSGLPTGAIAGSGGSGGTSSQGTAAAASGAWPIYIVVGGSAMSTTNPIFVNPATGATFPVSIGSLPSLAAGSNTIGGVTQSGAPWSVSWSGQSVGATQSGTWAVTPTNTLASTLSLTTSTTAYTSGQLAANNPTAGSITNPSFSMPSAGGAITRLRLQSTDTLSTAWQGVSVQIDLWTSAPTWTNGDHGAWLPATGSGAHLAQWTCTFPSAVWGDGLAAECTLNQGNYVSTTAATIYWSVEVTSNGGTLTASKALKLIAELN